MKLKATMSDSAVWQHETPCTQYKFIVVVIMLRCGANTLLSHACEPTSDSRREKECSIRCDICSQTSVRAYMTENMWKFANCACDRLLLCVIKFGHEPQRHRQVHFVYTRCLHSTRLFFSRSLCISVSIISSLDAFCCSHENARRFGSTVVLLLY